MNASQRDDTTAPRVRERAWLVQGLALAAGIVFLLLGVAGFVRTGLDNFAGNTDITVLGFEVNPLQNLVHVLLGAAGIALAGTIRGARRFGWVLAFVCGAATALGIISLTRPEGSWSLNGADNWLHGLGAVVGLLIVFLPTRRGRPAGEGFVDEESAGTWKAG